MDSSGAFVPVRFIDEGVKFMEETITPMNKMERQLVDELKKSRKVDPKRECRICL